MGVVETLWGGFNVKSECFGGEGKGISELSEGLFFFDSRVCVEIKKKSRSPEAR